MTPMGDNRGLVPTDVRFWAKVDKNSPIAPGMDTPCWIWKGALRGSYGTFGVGRGAEKRSISAHRMAWELTFGPLPPRKGHHGICVCHRCDVRLCCNPSHFFAGTQKENVRDAHRKGRKVMPPHCPPGKAARGEKSGAAKLTDVEVREIRAKFAAGVTKDALGTEYAVTPENIHFIVTRKTWRHVS